MSDTCKLCDKPVQDFTWRCEEHFRCDTCGESRRSEVYVGKDRYICKSCDEKRIKEAIENFSGDTDYTDEIVCAHCGYKETESYEWGQEDGVYECPDCGNESDLGVHLTISYSTEKKEATNA